MRPLIFHLADNSMVEGLRAFFQKDTWHYALGCRRFDIDAVGDTDFLKIPGGDDQVVWKSAGENLETFCETHERAIVILDEWFDPWPGAAQIKSDITADLVNYGWQSERIEIIVIQPMLESWVWMESDHVAKAFGWPSYVELREQLVSEGLWAAGAPNPHALKEACNRAARLGKTRSGRIIFRNVFRAVSSRSLNRCEEPGFMAMRSALQTWFPVEGVPS